MRLLMSLSFLLCALAVAHPALAQKDNAGGQIGGTYSAQGVNADGSKYTGTVVIKQDGNQYRFSWLISSGDTYQGVGKRTGNQIVVDWGAKYPVIYQVGDDGVLKGKWDNGKASETLERK